MSDFYSDNKTSWWNRFVAAIWNHLSNLWDDSTVLWDARGRDSWQNEDPKTWKTDN